ncbi:hypothetical protein CLOM_g5925 [Closterium sp. NIES-68]|nr:hypothetical protein CLOM_g5925 [Closterium sp. NIES-68]GJP63261.1 hypothetical protein CLOP_g20320 [Closterium sp. NIES-67]
MTTAAAAKSPVRKLSHTLCSSVLADIHKCASKKQTGVSLKYMMAHGSYPTERNLITAAQFLHHELPVRLAHRVTELENLPHGLSDKAPILKVRDWYVDSFKDIHQFPPIENAREEMRFTELLDQVRMRHNNVMPTVAMGVSELKRDLFADSTRHGLDSMPEIHQFLDRFYMSRIGIRMLIGQHVALHKPSPPPHYIGLICTKVSPVDVARNAVDDARSACMRTYGSAPDVHIYGDPDLRFAYVPAHLHQMLFELVKNSLRAVQERFADADHDPPPIRLIVADGMEDVTIKISDEGGGIPRSGLPRIWTYLYTTANSPIAAGNQLHEMPTVMAGYGYGLPISRLYARYFGGDLQVVSMEGYGTDVYLHLNRLRNVQEPLP